VGWVREAVLHSYPGAKVSWCTLGTKHREMNYHSFRYLFTFPIEHLLYALWFTYIV
jgi:hypothetical protein